MCERSRGTHRRGPKPPWQAAKVPLCADVGPRAQQHHEAQLLGELDEPLHVLVAIPLELAWVLLVPVPWHIHLRKDNIHTSRLKHCMHHCKFHCPCCIMTHPKQFSLSRDMSASARSGDGNLTSDCPSAPSVVGTCRGKLLTLPLLPGKD